MPVACVRYTTKFLLIATLLCPLRAQLQPGENTTRETVEAAQASFRHPSPGESGLGLRGSVDRPGIREEELAITDTDQKPQTGQASESVGTGGAGQSESAALDPVTQKELNKALEALRAGKPGNAKKHLEWATKGAPADPDVTYSWGLYYAETDDWAQAERYWSRTLQLYPRYPFALAGLAQLYLRKGDLPGAIDYLGQAVEASPASWHLEERLAEAYFLTQEYDSAQTHAEHANLISEDRGSLAQLILAKIYLQQSDRQRAMGILDTLLAHQPSGPRAEEAQRLVATLRQSPAATPLILTGSEGAKSAALADPEELVPSIRWMPPDVDERIPTVEAGVACPLEEIQEETGKRVREFVNAVNSIAATETLEHEVIDAHGFPSKRESRSYAYVVSLQEIHPGFYSVQEFRNGKTSQDVFPDHLGMFG